MLIFSLAKLWTEDAAMSPNFSSLQSEELLPRQFRNWLLKCKLLQLIVNENYTTKAILPVIIATFPAKDAIFWPSTTNMVKITVFVIYHFQVISLRSPWNCLLRMSTSMSLSTSVLLSATECFWKQQWAEEIRQQDIWLYTSSVIKDKEFKESTSVSDPDLFAVGKK